MMREESSRSGVFILDRVSVCLSHHLHLISVERKRHCCSPYGLIVGAARKPSQTFSSPRYSLAGFPMLTTYARGSMHPSLWLPNSHAVASWDSTASLHRPDALIVQDGRCCKEDGGHDVR